MVNQLSVVINTFNEAKNIQKAIESVKWAGEILVCDMYSEDKTAEIAQKLGAKVILHKKEGYVEPARNYAISRAASEWILILDADEEIPVGLAEKIREFINKPDSEFVKIPRKNIIFGHWMQASFWWPDYQIRLFKKGAVVWSDKIHIQPETKGEGLTLPAEEELAIIHHNYQTVGQFLERMNRYSDIEATGLIKDGYKFEWRDLIQKPLGEFLSRFFSNKGYQDGLHGLALSLLQAFSFLVVYLKVWEESKFKEEQINLSDVKSEIKISGKAIKYWFNNESRSFFRKVSKIFK